MQCHQLSNLQSNHQVVVNPVRQNIQPTAPPVNSGNIQTLSKSAKKRRRKNKNKNNQNFVAGNQVVLGDPSQKGISLSVLQPIKFPIAVASVAVGPKPVQQISQTISMPVAQPIKQEVRQLADRQPVFNNPKIVQPGQVSKIDE